MILQDRIEVQESQWDSNDQVDMRYTYLHHPHYKSLQWGFGYINDKLGMYL